MDANDQTQPQGLVGMGKMMPFYAAMPYTGGDEDPEEAQIPFSQYLWIIRRYRWRIVGFVAAIVAITVIISARLTPIYESTATIDIDRQTPTGVVGEDATRSAMNDADQYLATQMKLVESDSVLRPVDQRFHLREREGQPAPSDGVRAAEAPVTLNRLKVTRPPNTYLLLVSYRSPDPQLAADASNAIAESYLEHSYEIRLRSATSLSRFMEKELDELKAKMERSNLALAGFEKELDVINPEEKTNILSAQLLQLNTEYTSAQADRLKREAAWNSVRGGTLDAALAAPEGDGLRKLVDRQREAQELFVEMKTHYGPNHPEYKRATARVAEIEATIDAERKNIAARAGIEFEESRQHEGMVKDALASAKAALDHMSSRSFEYQALKREADADKHLYDELVSKIKEAGINAGFQNSAIRIADPARPAERPDFPDLKLNALLALLFSSLIGIGAAVVSDVLDTTVRDPDQVSRTLHVEVIGTLPLTKNRRMAAFTGSGSPQVLSQESQDLSGFHESVRTLRNSILLASFDRRYRSMLVTSAAPGEGKTTTAAHLAAAHAEQGKRTLLIDGDLRRPSVHRNFNLPCVRGLSNALLGETGWRQVLIQAEGLPGLDILPAGPPLRRASDFGGRGLTELLEEAYSEYDLVVLDAPPLLGFAEPLQMAAAVDGVLVVARAGHTSRKSVASVLGTLNRLRAKVIGIVLNEVHTDLSDSYSHYGYYRSYYRPIEGAES